MRLPDVALVGRKRSGKDTVGAQLTAQWGYQRLAFADPVRDLCREIDPIVGSHTRSGVWHSGVVFERYSALEDRVGYEEAKNVTEYRRTLQTVGESVRKVIGEQTWIDILIARVDATPRHTPLVVTDCRYRQEARALVEEGFVTVRVDRPGTDCTDSHVSETDLDDFVADYTLSNNGPLQTLHSRVASLMRLLVD